MGRYLRLLVLIVSVLFISTKAHSSNMSEQDYNRALSRIEAAHRNFFSAKNQRLEIISDWNEGTANAFADRDGETFTIEVFGGLARHPLITSDAFSLIICHELGHHLGGAPTAKDLGWPALEGQSDYFAALKCLKRVLEQDPDAGKPTTVDPTLAAKCAESFRDRSERRVCERVGMAGLSAANFFHMIEKKGLPPSFASPDLREVTKTLTAHAASQCRLDTYLAGAICSSNLALNPDVTDASKNVCWQGRDRVGFRPRCWFKP